ncbi:muscle M-line assembly protein unc-89-like isoform X2 [Planococcus citri]|uniref:muscle M-line assembly protein unc-89-like isoform X2 n=1 Tax=Planococcus citri TaxID=170843 RepID=UPI0031F95050
MYGIKDSKSYICKLRRPPETTKIGRHSSNQLITAPASRKVSRFHAEIVLNDVPEIKDISEWGVYVNDSRICKHRWMKLRAGDRIALGASTIEDGGYMLECVAWTPEDENLSSINHRVEVIDITEEDEDEVIELSDDEGNVQIESCASQLESTASKQVLNETATPEYKQVANETATPAEETPPTLNVEEKNYVSVSPSRTEEAIYHHVTAVVPSSIDQSTVPLNRTECNLVTKIEVPIKDAVKISSNKSEPNLHSEIEVGVPLEDAATIPTNGTEPDPFTKIKIPIKHPEIILKKIEPKFVDVTSSMNGLLRQTPTMPFKEQEFEYSNALQSIMDYSSDEESDSSFNDSSALTVNDEIKSSEERVPPDIKSKPRSCRGVENMNNEGSKSVKENVHKGWSKPYKQYSSDGYKTPPGENDSNDSSPSNSDETKKAHLVHKTLLTRKIAKIAIIQPLPNKSVGGGRRRKRIRSESPDTIDQSFMDSEHSQKSPEKSPFDDSDLQKSPTSVLSDLPPNVKNVCREQSLIALAIKQDRKKVSSKQNRDKVNSKPTCKQARENVTKKLASARERMKALYPTPPVQVKRTAETRPKPKVKVTAKNRGDFLTKEEVAPAHRSPAKSPDVPISPKAIETVQVKRTAETRTQPKVKVTAKNRGDFLTREEIASVLRSPAKTTNVPIDNKVVSDEPTTEEMEENGTSPNSSDEHHRSVDEILDGIEFPTATMDDGFREIAPVPPPIKTTRTIEVSVNFTKVPPLKRPVVGSSSKLIGESILKKSLSESHSSGEESSHHLEKKRVTFPKGINIVSGYAENTPRYSFSTMVNRDWPAPPEADCHNCGENGHSTKRCTKDPICYNCLRTGHISTVCTRPKQIRDPRLLKQMQGNGSR